MSRKHKSYGGIVGAGPLVNAAPRTSGVFNLGGLSGDNAFEVPSLDLHFDGQLSSFTRATTSPTAPKANGDQLATEIVTQNKSGSVQSKYMGPNGKLVNGYVSNLVPHSTDFSTSAGWTHTQSPQLTTGQADPFGGTAATTVKSTANLYSMVEYTVTPGGDPVLTASIFVKKQSNTITDQVCLLRLRANGASPPGLFELQIKPQDGSYNFNDRQQVQPDVLEATREDFGDWWRFSITAGQPNFTPTGYVYQFFPDVGTSFAAPADPYDNTGTGAVTIFGAQFEVAGSVSQYVSSTASPAQVPRVEYDSSGNPLGLLVEEARENYIANSSDFLAAAWGGTITSSHVTTGQSDPTGGTGASVLNDNVSTSGSAVYLSHLETWTTSPATDDYWTASIFVKKNSGSSSNVHCLLRIILDNGLGYYDLTLNPNDGTTSSGRYGSPTVPTTKVEDLGDWYRMSITATQGYAHQYASFGFFPQVGKTYNGNSGYDGGTSTGSVIVWGAQFEKGEGATSHIPTNGAAATRTADDITLATSSFGYNRAASSVFVDFSMGKANSTYPGVFRIDDGTNTNNEVLYYDAITSEFKYQNKETTSTSWAVETSVSLPVSRAFAVRASGTEARPAIDGVLGSAQTLNAAPSTTLTTIQVGRQQAAQLNGHMRRFTYWPRAINDASLVAYTGANPPTELVARTTRRWGGMAGRSLVSGGNVETTGVLSLAEHYQSKL